jgi:hypothetical protein
MTQYALIVHQPDGPPPADLDLDAVMRDVDALRQEMQDAGVWVFSGGLHDPSTATVVQLRDGEVLMTDGPFTEGHEHIGGLTVVEVEDLDAALGWGRRFAQAINGLAIEVRPFRD